MSDIKTRRLTPNERDAAVLAAKAGDGEARRRLIEDNYALIVSRLHKLGAYRRHSAHEVEEIMQDMVFAVDAAIDRVDPARGASPGKALSTVVCWAIYGRYTAYLRGRGRMKRRAVLNRDPEVLRSLPARPDDGRTESHVAACESFAREALAWLPERDATVLRLRYGIGCERRSLGAVAATMGVSMQRVQQIEAAALRRLAFAARRHGRDIPDVA